MKSILISIKPEWVAKILNGEKSIELRKTAPKCDLPIDVYIYCTKGDNLFRNRFGWFASDSFEKVFVNGEPTKPVNGKVVAKFTLREVEKITQRKICGEWEVYGEHTDFIELDRMSCLEQDEIMDYMGGNYHAYAWHISDLVIFDEPMELEDFGLKRAPQSWQYIEVQE